MSENISLARSPWHNQALAHIETHLDYRLEQDTEANTPLGKAMRYAVMNGGKRLRALLVCASSGVNWESTLTQNQHAQAVLDTASGLEFMHAYSLVHDDLPALDNDDLRRGLPTVHKHFDEATAILVGDALQSLALLVVARHNNTPSIQTLAQAALLMCQGQMRDLSAIGKTLTLNELEILHQQKTGALIRAAVLMGAYCAQPAMSEAAINYLDHFSRVIGLAFQIRDDVLDGTSTERTLGKSIGKDCAQNKPTFVTMLGLVAANKRLALLLEESMSVLNQFAKESPLTEVIAQRLRGLAQFVVVRSS